VVKLGVPAGHYLSVQPESHATTESPSSSPKPPRQNGVEWRTRHRNPARPAKFPGNCFEIYILRRFFFYFALLLVGLFLFADVTFFRAARTTLRAIEFPF